MLRFVSPFRSDGHPALFESELTCFPEIPLTFGRACAQDAYVGFSEMLGVRWKTRLKRGDTTGAHSVGGGLHPSEWRDESRVIEACVSAHTA